MENGHIGVTDLGCVSMHLIIGCSFSGHHVLPDY